MMIRSTHTALLVLLTLTLLFAGCGRDEFGAPASSAGDIVEPEAPDTRNAEEPIDDGNTALPVDPSGGSNVAFGELSAFDLYRATALNSPNNVNIAINPLGLSQAFVALHLAASGETKEFIGKQIKFDGDTTYEAFSNYNDNARRDSDISVSGIWIDEQFQPQQSFVNDVGMLLNLPVRTLSFDETNDARGQINTFVRNQSDGFLGETISPRGIEPGTFVIANAHLFDSPWALVFDPDRTERVTFSGGDADIMFQTGDYLLYDSPALAAVVVPMANDFEAIFIAPAEGDLQDLEAQINLEFVMNLLNTMTYETVDLGLPKFDFSYGFRLSEIATEIDSEFLFDDGMFENLSPGIAMGDLFQETRIVMNESGVSSATDPIRTDVPPEGARSLILNRPMLFVIIDKNIDGVRTIGRVVTP